MQSSDFTELHYLVPSNPTPYQTSFSFPQSGVPMLHPFYHFQITPQVQDFNPQPQPPCFSNNSTSDEADDQRHSLINERKQRRMISNRESARRSRMRKQRHLDELWSQVVWLRNENHQLMDKLNHASERHDEVLQENARLKEEASGLRQMLTDMQLKSPFPALSLDELPCGMAYLNTESSNETITDSTDLFL